MLVNPQSLIGLSGAAASVAVYDKSLSQTALRSVAGGPLFLSKISTGTDKEPQQAASLLLAPSSLGEITTLNLKPGNYVRLKRGSFLAASENVNFKSSIGGGVFGRGVKLSVFGEGQVAIHGYGTLHKLLLKENEEYYVDPGYLVAFKASKEPEPLIYNEIISIPVPTSTSLSTLVQMWLYDRAVRAALFSVDVVKRIITLNGILQGRKKGLYKLSGPGEFYLQSRKEPVLGGFINAYAGLKHQGALITEAWKAMNKSSSVALPLVEPPSVYDDIVAKSVVTVTRPSSSDKKPEVKFETVSTKKQERKKDTIVDTPKKPEAQKEKPEKRTWKTLIFGKSK